jgi:hypothetical protein
VSLTEDERAAGRVFRHSAQGALDALNGQDPPGLWVLPLWRVVRHDCPARGGASTGIALRERRWSSPRYVVVDGCPPRLVPDDGISGFTAGPGGARVTEVARGMFAFVYKEGKCSGSGCGLTARSRAGRLVLGDDSPGRGGQAPAHPGNTRQPGS